MIFVICFRGEALGEDSDGRFLYARDGLFQGSLYRFNKNDILYVTPDRNSYFCTLMLHHDKMFFGGWRLRD